MATLTKKQLLEDLGTMQKIHYEFCQQIRKMRKAQKAYERNKARHKPLIELTDEEFDKLTDQVEKVAILEIEVDDYLKEYFSKQ